MIASIFSECSDGSRPNKMWLKSFMKVMLSRNNNSERALVDANRELIARMEAKIKAKLAEVWEEEATDAV